MLGSLRARRAEGGVNIFITSIQKFTVEIFDATRNTHNLTHILLGSQFLKAATPRPSFRALPPLIISSLLDNI